MKERDLVCDVFHGVLEFPALTSGLRFNATHHGFSRFQVRLCRIDSRFLDADCDLIGLPVEFEEEIPFLYAVLSSTRTLDT